MTNLDLRLDFTRRRLTVLLVACVCGLALFLAACTQQALAAPTSASFGGGGAPIVPYIIGGQESSISQFPWQVYVQRDAAEGGGRISVASCGGSILDATHVLTAAHCVDHEGTTETYPAEDVRVLAGASDVSGFSSSLIAPPGSQERQLSSIRTHPYYSPLPNIKDDVAVLELSSPLELSAESNAQAISLVPTGVTPAPGTALSISGYGKENGAEGSEPDGKLYSTTLTAIGSDACREAVGINSAVLLCAESSSSSTCQGDSGGPLTEGSPAVQVGIVDFGPKGCPVGGLNGFTNVAAPEVRAFIEGSQTPPEAARPTSPPVITSVGTTPVDFSPLTCNPGTWSGSPSFTYTFQVENASAQVFQSGPGNIFASPSVLVGAPLVCIVQASNPGGVTTARSETTPPIAADTAPPVASIKALKCHLQACTLLLTASDPHSVALSEQASGAYTVAVKCPKKKKRSKKGKKPAKRPVCHKTLTVPMSLTALSAGSFQATMSRLPYGEEIIFIFDVSDAAGLQAAPTSVDATLHKPKPKQRKKHPKHK
jgi:secreted trypsin-like serine protease